MWLSSVRSAHNRRKQRGEYLPSPSNYSGFYAVLGVLLAIGIKKAQLSLGLGLETKH